MPKGNKRFTTHLNNMLHLGATYAIKYPRSHAIGRKATTHDARADLQKWRARIALTSTSRKYWGQTS